MRVSRKLAIVGIAVALAAGCSSPESELQAAAPDPMPDVPVVAMRFECYGECGALQPPTLPTVAVYPDGTTITAQFEDGNELTLRRGSVTSETVRDLLGLAEAAELNGAGVLPELQIPDGIGIADGGGTVFSLRSGSKVATRNVPHRYEQADFNSEGLRRRYLQLQQALLDLPAGERWEWSKEALLVEQLDRPPGTGEPTWEGPDFRSKTEETDLGACAITSTLGPLMANATFEQQFDVGGEAWTVRRRPLLPHEDSCPEVDDLLLHR